MVDSTMDCFVCRKHRDRGSLMPGGPVAEIEGLVRDLRGYFQVDLSRKAALVTTVAVCTALAIASSGLSPH